jgi:hypothetical protein
MRSIEDWVSAKTSLHAVESSAFQQWSSDRLVFSLVTTWNTVLIHVRPCTAGIKIFYLFIVPPFRFISRHVSALGAIIKRVCLTLRSLLCFPSHVFDAPVMLCAPFPYV